jgi:hypothetical protein
VFKGDEVTNIDEISDFQTARYISASEGCWRLFEFDLTQKSHVVTRLPVHLPGRNLIYFNHRNTLQDVLEADHSSKLEAYFRLNMLDPSARELKYWEIPEYYTWEKDDRKWKRRSRNGKPVIGRMYTCSPSEGSNSFFSTHGYTNIAS